MLPDRVLMAAASVRETLKPGDELCCVFARRVLEQVYGANVIARAPLPMWSVWPPPDNTDPWSAPAAAVRVGIASAVTKPPVAPALLVGRWHLVQGWDVPLVSGGHTMLWFAATPTTGYRLDSAAAKWRPAPGPQVNFERWHDLTARFDAGVAVAALNPA